MLDTCLCGRKGILPVKSGGWWRWALISPDGVAPSWMVGVSASVNLPLHQKFSSGTSSPGWSRKKGRKMVVLWCGYCVRHPITVKSLCYRHVNTVCRLHHDFLCTLSDVTASSVSCFH